MAASIGKGLRPANTGHVLADLAIQGHDPLPRRPKPPSLKEQALIELGDVYNRDKIDDVTYDTIRKALEQLND